MRRVRIDPMDYPLKKGESWWVVHPNIATAEFRVPPNGAITLCTNNFLDFTQNVVYPVITTDSANGWITVGNSTTLYDMPQYVFARYFDAEAFVVGQYKPEELEKAKPFDYSPTVPFHTHEEILYKG